RADDRGTRGKRATRLRSSWSPPSSTPFSESFARRMRHRAGSVTQFGAERQGRERLSPFALGGRELVDEREQLFVAADHGCVGRVLAVDDDRRDAADAIAPVQLVGALQLGLHSERIERGLERGGVDAEAAEELLQLRFCVEPVAALVDLAEESGMHFLALTELLRGVERARVDLQLRIPEGRDANEMHVVGLRLAPLLEHGIERVAVR